MLNHVRTVHTKERPFVCVRCHADFTTRRALNQHEQRIHGDIATTAQQNGGGNGGKLADISCLTNSQSVFYSGEPSVIGGASSSVQVKLEMDPDDMFGGNHNNNNNSNNNNININNNNNEGSAMSRLGVLNGGSISEMGPPDADDDDDDGKMKSDDEMSFGSLCSSETSLDIPLDTSTSERLAGMLTSRVA